MTKLVEVLKRKGFTEDEIKNQFISALELQMPQEVVNPNGIPLSGNCPRCNAQLTILSSPVGCKWCLQKLKWEGDKEE